MRILITGAHSTGKSTLARRLAKDLKLPLISNISRSAAKKGLLLNKNSVTTQLWIFLRQMQKEDQFLEKHRSFVSDRSFDNVVYSDYFRVFDKCIIDLMKSILSQRVRRIFHKIIFLRPTIPLDLSDPLRSGDKLYRIAIDQEIKRFLKDFDYFEVTETDFEKRVALVKGYLASPCNFREMELIHPCLLSNLKSSN